MAIYRNHHTIARGVFPLPSSTRLANISRAGNRTGGALPNTSLRDVCCPRRRGPTPLNVFLAVGPIMRGWRRRALPAPPPTMLPPPSTPCGTCSGCSALAPRSRACAPALPRPRRRADHALPPCRCPLASRSPDPAATIALALASLPPSSASSGGKITAGAASAVPASVSMPCTHPADYEFEAQQAAQGLALRAQQLAGTATQCTPRHTRRCRASSALVSRASTGNHTACHTPAEAGAHGSRSSSVSSEASICSTVPWAPAWGSLSLGAKITVASSGLCCACARPGLPAMRFSWVATKSRAR
jgi:hypothetical protein